MKLDISTAPPTGETPESVVPRTSYLALAALAASIAGLLYYKWGGAGRTIDAVKLSGHWDKPIAGLISATVVNSTTFYFSRIWIALVYGLLVGAGVQVLAPTFAVRFRRRSALGGQLMGAAMGAPLMLCSCCITPVFASMRAAAGARSAVALLLSSPGLNPAAIALTFLLFPLDVAAVRLAAALLLVIVVPVAMRWVVRPETAQGAVVEMAAEARAQARSFLADYVRSLGMLARRTVPAIVVGAIVSAWLFPRLSGLNASHHWAVLAIIAAVAVLLTLPTFFELPLALLAVAAGFPGAGAVILIAGPIVNLPSLISVAREVGTRASIVLAASVWSAAFAAGLLVMLRA